MRADDVIEKVNPDARAVIVRNTLAVLAFLRRAQKHGER